MKILAFADTHGSLPAGLKTQADKADIIICAGDMTVFEDGISQKIAQIAALGKKTLVIHGNHEGEQRLAKECSKHPNLFFLHSSFYDAGDYVISGWGGGGFATLDHKFERHEPDIDLHSKGKGLVMVFHGPPYGNATDEIGADHVGCKSYTEYIKKRKPMLVICGHLHENFGVQGKIGKTIIINPGPDGRLITITRTS